MRWTHTIHYAVGGREGTDERNFRDDAEVAEYVKFVAAFRDLRGLPPHDIAKIINNKTGKIVYER